jgi:Rha family phage regulatory protein
MNKLMSSNEITMSSRDIAEFTGKRHDHVMRDIKKMLLDLYPAGSPNFGGTYLNEQNKQLPLLNLDRKHTDCLLTGYSAVARMKVIERWIELENNQHKIPQTYGEALQLAANQAVQIEDQQKQLTQQAPAVEFVDNYTKAESGSKGFRAVAKLLKANERVFRKFLVDKDVMYKLKGEWTVYGCHVYAGRFETTTGEKNNHIYNEVLFTAKGITWIAGEYAKSKVEESK